MTEKRRLRLDDQLCFALYAATNAITRTYRPLLQEIGLTYPQYLVMLVLWQDGELSVQGIARRLGLSSNAVTPLLDRLVDGGLVLRRRDTEDRRVIRIAATRRGADLERAAFEAQQAVVCRTELPPDDFAVLREELLALARRMGGEEAPTHAPR